MTISPEEILETIEMIESHNLDVRTVTMGINIGDCAGNSISEIIDNVERKIVHKARHLKPAVKEIELKYGIPIVNMRIAVSPVANLITNASIQDFVELAKKLDGLAERMDVDFIGGFTALVHKGITCSETTFLDALPDVLSLTDRVCASVNIASTKAGINMNAVMSMGHIIKEIAYKTRQKDGVGCARLVVFANAVEDNPFMAGAFHGQGEGDYVINVGVSGPGVIKNVIANMPEGNLGILAEEIKKTAFKITRMGEMVGREISKKIGVEFGILDLSLAPTPAVGDSIADIIKEIGVDMVGAPGTTAALAILTDAVKKGGAFASSYIGGLSGAFIPVSEDAGMVEAVRDGALCIEKLEAMTSVCSVGLDMIAIPGNTAPETISAIIADEAAIGVINNKTTGVRIIPVPGKDVGEKVFWGGLLGEAIVMKVSNFGAKKFISRGGRIPAPLGSLRN